MEKTAKQPMTTTRVEKDSDGVYRWTYALNMFTNPAILVTVMKIIVPLFSIPLIVTLVRTAIDNDWAKAWEGNMWGSSIKMCIFILVLFIGITLLSYLIVAAMYGGKYIVHFTMDGKKLLHATDPHQQRKAQAVGALTAITGSTLSAKGAGLLAASRTESTTDLSSVRRIKVRRAFNLIKVNQLLNHNQVYVPAEDFDTVLDFLLEHCPKAK